MVLGNGLEAQVERQIAEQNDWDLPAQENTVEPTPQAGSSPSDMTVSAPLSSSVDTVDQEGAEKHRQLRRQLENAGLTTEMANALLDRFDPVRIHRQLMWLPYRRVRNAAGFLIAAIKDYYAAPPRLQSAETSKDMSARQAEDTNSSSEIRGLEVQPANGEKSSLIAQEAMVPMPISGNNLAQGSEDSLGSHSP
jgi:hypothetical protein